MTSFKLVNEIFLTQINLTKMTQINCNFQKKSSTPKYGRLKQNLV